MISPKQTVPFGGPRINLTGVRLKGVTEAHVGPVRIDRSKLQIIGETQISFDLPLPAALGATPVTVTNPAGRSNALTLTITERRPPLLVVPPTGFVGFPLSYQFAGGASAAWVLIIAPNNTTFRFMGADVLRDFIPLAVGQLDAIGVGTHQFTPPPVLRNVRLWSQLATFKAGVFDGASNIASTLVF